MKFVLKVFVLVCLIVISKLAKDEAVALEKPLAETGKANAIFTNHLQRSPLAERHRAPLSVKIERSSLQFN